MKITKYKKDRQNKYKVTIDDEDYILYDDVIIHFNLLMKDTIDEKFFNEVLSYNDELKSYYESIKYINKKLRSEKEVREFLLKKDISKSIIDKTIRRLKDTNYLNDEIFLKSYINDQINLTNNGPKKIISNLLKLGLDEDKIHDYLNKIDECIWFDKIDKYISKKIKVNHSSSAYMLKNKIKIDLINLGYDKEYFIDSLNKFTINDKEIYNKEKEKIRKKYEKKYSGYELDRKIKEALYRKGFNNFEGSGDYEE